MRWSLLVLALAWMLLVPVPALSQPSQEGSSGAQYDQYGGPVPGVGGQAVHDAIVASGAIRASAEEAQTSAEEAQAADEGTVSAADLAHATGGPDLASAGEAGSGDPAGQDESTSDIEKLPDTGGPSPLWLGAPLLCAGGLLARRILL